MSNAKERLLAGTILSAVVLGSIHAAPLPGNKRRRATANDHVPS